MTGQTVIPSVSTASVSHRPLTVVLLTCATAAMSFAGAVTLPALLTFVLPGVAVGALASARGVLTGHWLQGLCFGSAAGLVWAEVVNLVGGDLSGPIARSTLITAAGTAAALGLAACPAPAAFLAPVAGIVLGAVLLGSAGEVAYVAVATAIAAMLALAWLESEGRKWLVAPRAVGAVVALTLFSGGASVVALTLQHQLDTNATVVVAPGLALPTLRPPWDTSSPTPTPTPTASSPAAQTPTSTITPSPAPAGDVNSAWLMWALAVFAVGLLTLGLLILARWLWVRWAWSRLRRRLRRGTPEAQVIGAWWWAKYRLAYHGVALTASIPPGEGASTASSPLPPSARAAFQALSELTSLAAFAKAATLDAATADDAWRMADEVDQIPSQGTRMHRCAAWNRLPAPADRL